MVKKAADIDLLLISDLYPKPDDPVRGIFVQDHARALRPFVRSVSVADLQLSGKRIERRQDRSDPGIQVLQGGVFSKEPPGVLKAALYSLWTTRAEKRIQSEFRPDMIHAHGGILSGTLARRLASKRKIPYFITEHFRMVEQWGKNPLKKRILKKNYRGAQNIIGVSNKLTEQISPLFPKSSFRTVPDPVDTMLFHTGPQERKKQMLFASRLDPNKGGLRTLKAFDAIHEEYPEWKLELYGEGKEAEAIQVYLEARPSLKERVVFGPRLDRGTLSEKMREASFMVLPSEYESFGLVIAESLSSGTPVIAPDRTGPADILFDGAGIGIDPTKERELENAMAAMIKAHGSYIPEEMHEKIERYFSMERIGSELSKLYESSFKG